jgi:hypothetical protein
MAERYQSFIKEQRMRKLAKPTEQEISEGPQSVSFQIANGNVRQRCVLQTELPTRAQAQKYLLTNWSIIERMARDALAAGTIEDGEIKLVMI